MAKFLLMTTKGSMPIHKAVVANIQSATLVAVVSVALSIGLGIAR
jgi:hypothetical protein